MNLIDVEQITSLRDALIAVGTLQPMYSSGNTYEMQARCKLVRKVIPNLIKQRIKLKFEYPIYDLSVEGKDGVGRKSEVPWIRLHSKELSPSATAGWYIVFLFDTTGEKVFLSLNQGSTRLIENSFVPRPEGEVTARSQWARKTIQKLGLLSRELPETMQLKAHKSNLGPSYEASNIYALPYNYEHIPPDSELFNDIQYFLNLLSALYSQEKNDLKIPGSTPPEVQLVYEAVNAASGKTRARSGQGFYASPEIRALIEEYAMKAAKSYFEADGWKLTDCSTREPFDYLCRCGEEKIYLEVKGTSSLGESIILTRNEVAHMGKNYPKTALFLMSEVEITKDNLGNTRCEGGKIEVFYPWKINQEQLKVISYQYFIVQ